MTAGGLRCDGCDKHERTSVPYPQGWLRLHIHGRRASGDNGDSVTSMKLDQVDVCSTKCAPKAISAAYTLTLPSVTAGEST